MAESIRVLIADDHEVVRKGLRALLESAPGITVVGEAADGEEAVRLHARLSPDVAVLDLRMPVRNAIQATEEIRRASPGARVLVLSTYDHEEDVLGALRAGASGYLLKDASAPELLDAVRAVHAGLRRIPSGLAARLQERASTPELTPREREVLDLMAHGMGNVEIAERLHTTEGTVKSYVNRIFGKLGVTRRTQAVLAALQRGLSRLE